MKRKVYKPNVVRGGTAVPLGANYYYMTGRKHSQGGIDIGHNPKTGLEVEDGEVMHVTKNDVKVFSSVPFLNGKSPAERVMSGDNPNKVFNAQEQYKDKHNMNDDGTKRNKRKAKTGGLYSVTSNGRTKLYPFPSTGEWDRSSDKSKRAKKVEGGPKGINPDLYEEEDDYEYNPSLSPKVNDELREEHIESKRRSTIGQNPNPTDNSSSTTVIIKDDDKKPKDNWFSRTTKNVKKYINDNPDVVADSIGLTSNVIGGLVSYKMNKDMLSKLKYNGSPVSRKAAKLKTRININPQLDKMRETLAAYERSVDNNTASSRVALARKQRARLASMMSTNELYGNKENIETELINKDRLNQQSVTDANIRDYNTWAEKRAAFRNAVEEKKGENEVSLINTINAGIQDTIARREKRDAERQTRLAMIAGHPNVNPRILRDMGVKGITDKEIEAFDKAYGKKKKDKKSSKKD
jgi:hypothetical protein